LVLVRNLKDKAVLHLGNHTHTPQLQSPLCYVALLPLSIKTYKRHWDGLGQSKIATCRKHGYYGRHEHPRRFNNNNVGVKNT